MATSFEPRSSFRSSQNRAPKAESANATIPNSNALPDIDFGFESLRKDMDRFTLKFDHYIDAERMDVLDTRNEYRSTLAELQESTTLKSRSVTLLTSSASTHAATLSRETAETASLKTEISSLTTSRDAHSTHNAGLNTQIAHTKSLITQKLAAQAAYAEKVAAQAALNTPELAFYEEYLGLRIESREDDVIAFVFCCVDERDAERECEVVLDLGRRDYVVKVTRPRLEDGAAYGQELRRCVEGLNEGRALAPFLKAVRELFRRRCREGA